MMQERVLDIDMIEWFVTLLKSLGDKPLCNYYQDTDCIAIISKENLQPFTWHYCVPKGKPKLSRYTDSTILSHMCHYLPFETREVEKRRKQQSKVIFNRNSKLEGNDRPRMWSTIFCHSRNKVSPYPTNITGCRQLHSNLFEFLLLLPMLP